MTWPWRRPWACRRAATSSSTAPPRERRNGDWTAGCIAVTNREMEDIYAMVQRRHADLLHPA
jgi:hypothetical protein